MVAADVKGMISTANDMADVISSCVRLHRPVRVR